MSAVLLSTLALLAVFVFWSFLLARSRAARVTPIRSDDPWLLSAVERARSSFPEMQQLLAAGEQVTVKLPLTNQAGEVEHVWGGIDAADDEGVQVVILTPLLVGPTPDGPLRIPRAELEDWQVFLADGAIRGGFTTQAQLAVCRREKLSIPRALRDQETRFLDPIEFPLPEKAP